MSAQYRKELKSLFFNMTGVTFIAIVLILTGIFSTIINLKSGYASFEYVFTESLYLFFFIVAVPILTMRSFSDEKSAKTDQLLYSLPIGMTKVVLGKFAAMVSVFGCAVGVMCLYPIVISFYGHVNFVRTYGAFLAFFLLGCALIAIGMFISSLTESVVLSAIISIGSFVLLFFIPWLSYLIPGTPIVSLFCFIILAVIIGLFVHIMLRNYVISAAVFAVLAGAAGIVYAVNAELFTNLFPKMLQALVIFNKLDNFVLYGLIDISSLVYFITVTVLFIYLTVRSMDKKRWS